MDLRKNVINKPWYYCITYYWNWKLMFNTFIEIKKKFSLKELYNLFYVNLDESSSLFVFLEREKSKKQLYRFCKNHVDYEIAESF